MYGIQLEISNHTKKSGGEAGGGGESIMGRKKKSKLTLKWHRR